MGNYFYNNIIMVSNHSLCKDKVYLHDNGCYCFAHPFIIAKVMLYNKESN